MNGKNVPEEGETLEPEINGVWPFETTDWNCGRQLTKELDF